MKRTLNCNGIMIDLATPRVMSILNITPDSFFSESRANSMSDILKKVESMIQDGATFIDVGAYSSRPGASFVSEEEERNRLIPALKIILNTFPNALISVDTFRSKIATESIDLGACMINDISGGDMDDNMYNVVSKHQVPYILMHLRGNSKTMASFTKYNYLIKDIISELQIKVKMLTNLGINDIIIDPGLGFAKSINQNFTIIKELKLFEQLNRPILIGASRKSMIYKTLDISPEEALNGTSIVHTASLLNGASILRVHDVKEAIEAIKITNLLKN